MVRKITIWIIFYLATIVAASSAALWEIQSYYFELEQPPFAPPAWLFGPVWTILYIFVATIGYRIVMAPQSDIKPVMIALWTLQFALNTIWTPSFFGAQNLGIALIYIGALDVVVLITMALLWSRDRISFLLALPYIAWIGFATALNASFFLLNG
jgi:tryptophan-rich sensory protein